MRGGGTLNESKRQNMRLKHVPGEKAFVDYTDGIDIYDLNTGEVVSTELFVGTLPFSSYVYAEFTFSQKLFEFIESHERMWKYFGGVTSYTVTDNLKSSVNRAHLYDPDKNKTFTAYANHAGFAVLPARSNRPKDKANVECHAGLIQRTFYQEVRNPNLYLEGRVKPRSLGFLRPPKWPENERSWGIKERKV